MREVEPCSDGHTPRMEGSAGAGGARVGEGIHWGWCQRKKNLVTGVKACHVDGRGNTFQVEGPAHTKVEIQRQK